MANVNINRTTTPISQPDRAIIQTAFETILDTLQPYLVTLTEEERKTLLSLSEENLVFSQDALEQAQTLGSLLPPALSGLVTNMENDMQLYRQLNSINDTALGQLNIKVLDTRRVAAHESYSAALAIYKIIESLASVGVEGAQQAYNVLKERFANQGGRPNDDDNP